MAIFVPAILETNVNDFKLQFERIEPLVERIHVDFADSTLVPSRSLLPVELEPWDTLIELDAHLMVDQPSQYFPILSELSFRRAVVHIECQEDKTALAQQAATHQFELAYAISPQTAVNELTKLPNAPAFILVMGVHPGYGNQPMLEETFERIRAVKQLFPQIPLAVDGGVRQHNVQTLLDAGVDILVVGRGGYDIDNDVSAGIEQWRAFANS